LEPGAGKYRDWNLVPDELHYPAPTRPKISMLTHAQIWTGIDRLAAHAGLSPSGLAKRAGLDPTTFNKSKRVTISGRERWPSTESLAKSLAATGTSLDQFVALLNDTTREGVRTIPFMSFAEASDTGLFDEQGFPLGDGWEHIGFGAIEDEHAYALEISGDAMLPVYRDGTIIVVSPAAAIRRGDRIVLRTSHGEMMAKELKRRTGQIFELKSFHPEQADRVLAVEDVLWAARIMWATQ
jgi:phage repressor protein C with HTH and peptisase S24 domain